MIFDSERPNVLDLSIHSKKMNNKKDDICGHMILICYFASFMLLINQTSLWLTNS